MGKRLRVGEENIQRCIEVLWEDIGGLNEARDEIEDIEVQMDSTRGLRDVQQEREMNIGDAMRVYE